MSKRDWSSDVCSSDLGPDGTEIKLLREIRFPHSLGMLYSTFTAYLGFAVNEGEYKVMRSEERRVGKVCRLRRMQDRLDSNEGTVFRSVEIHLVIEGVL